MKKLIHEIRQQPLHIRHIFMWTMVVITFSVVGFAWFESTRKDFVALLHSPTVPVGDERALAQGTPEPASPFATIKNSFTDLGANISQLIGWDDNEEEPLPDARQTIPPQQLP